MSTALHASTPGGRTSSRHEGGPRPPSSLEETGVGRDVIRDLILRIMEERGTMAGFRLAREVGLPFLVIEDLMDELRAQRLLEVKGTRGAARIGYELGLTEAGRERAARSRARCAYTGPAPVSLREFTERVRSQSIRQLAVPTDRLDALLSDLTLPEGFTDRIGPALVAGHSIFLFGEPGNGKTAVAERLAELWTDPIYLPWAVQVEGNVMTVYDPATHHRIVRRDEVENEGDGLLRGETTSDRRFVRVRRPGVMVGGELDLTDLDLQYDPSSGIYRPPLQVKAAGGVLVMDDFGRQRVEPAALLNRWILPLERHVDYLRLHTGFRFPIPFDSLLVFASNADPDRMVDEAFLRRIRYKIRMPSPDRTSFREIFRKELLTRPLDLPPETADRVWDDYLTGHRVEARSCHPRDILDHVEDLVRFRGGRVEDPAELLPIACETYFLRLQVGASHPPEKETIP